MKLALLYIILLVSCLLGTHDVGFARDHSGEKAFSMIEKQNPQADHVIGIEDENDEDELTKKFTTTARWLAAFSQTFLVCNLVDNNNNFSSYAQSYNGGNIYIVHRVLRI